MIPWSSVYYLYLFTILTKLTFRRFCDLQRPQYIYTISIFTYRKVQRNQTYLYSWLVTTSALLTADFYMASTKNVKHNEAPLQESTTFLLKLYSTFYIVYNASTLWCVLNCTLNIYLSSTRITNNIHN